MAYSQGYFEMTRVSYWVDPGIANLYLRRNGKELVILIEHRAAPSGDAIPYH